MLADGVFHLARYGLEIALGMSLHMGEEIVGEQLDRGDLGLMPRSIRCSLMSAFTFSPASAMSSESSLNRSLAAEGGIRSGGPRLCRVARRGLEELGSSFGGTS